MQRGVRALFDGLLQPFGAKLGRHVRNRAGDAEQVDKAVCADVAALFGRFNQQTRQFRARADIIRQNLADPKRKFFLRQADFGAKFFRHARID